MRIKLPTNTKKGFTLIELLTVISIISVLTAVLTVAFVAVSGRSRDATRKNNIKQIQSALELYKNDNGTYPPTATITSITCNSPFRTGVSPNFITYMTKFPCDPKGTLYSYVTASSDSTYTLASCLENSADKEARIGGTAPAGLSCNPAAYYIVTNP